MSVVYCLEITVQRRYLARPIQNVAKLPSKRNIVLLYLTKPRLSITYYHLPEEGYQPETFRAITQNIVQPDPAGEPYTSLLEFPTRFMPIDS
jgi:hypothetical protein